jgi:tetratricopeptide (TPR) repeat protein
MMTDRNAGIPGLISSAEQELLEKGRVLLKAGKSKEAIAHFEDTLNTLEMTYGEDAIELAECLLELGEAYETGARPTDALRIYGRTLRLGRQVLGDNDPAVIEVLLKLIELNESLGRPADALVYCEQAVAAAHQSLPEDSPVTQQIMDRYHHFANLAGRRAQKPPEKPVLETPALSARDTSDAEAEAESTLTGPAAENHFDKVADEIENTSVARPKPDATANGSRPGSRSRPSSTKVDNQEFGRGRKKKALALQLIAAATALGVLIFLVRLIPATAPATTAPSNQAVTTAESSLGALYHTADQSKKIRLGKNNRAQLISGNTALVLPDRAVGNDWTGLMEAFVDSVKEKQIWAERKESQLKTEDGTLYYAADGPEVLVLAKMARVAGNAQASLLRTGEFPKAVTDDMIVQYSFQNPLDGRDNPVQIRAMLDDNSDVKAALESGAIIGDEQPNSPCKITCYAVQANVSDARGTKLKTKQFFIRGCDRYGAFLLSGQGKKVFVVLPSDAYLRDLEPVQKSASEGQPSGKIHGARRAKNTSASAKNVVQKNAAPKNATQKNEDQPAAPSSAPQAPPLQEEAPGKPTTLWVISNPPCPILYIHYGLALLLFGAAVAAFIVSRMSGSDMRGRTTASGSNVALIFAAILLLATVLVLAAQLVVFI